MKRKAQAYDGQFYPVFRNAENVPMHTCSICQRVSPWHDSWKWYGSYREMEDGAPILKTCSDGCWNEAISRQYVPLNAPLLDDR